MALEFKLNKSNFIKGFFIYILVLNYVFDALNKIFGLYYPDLSRIGLVFRIFSQLFIFIFLFVFITKKRFIALLIFFYFIFCFIIANISLKIYTNIEFSILEQFVYLNKYFFLIMSCFVFEDFFNNRENLNKAKSVFLKIFYFNGFLALAGLFFNIKLFRIFTGQTIHVRFGYNGLINAINESSLFYLLAIILIYHDWRYLGKKSSKLILALFFTLIVGTKAVYLGLVFLVIYHIVTTIRLKNLLIGFGVILLSFGILFKNIEKLRTVFGYLVYKATHEGILYTFTGGRNELLLERLSKSISGLDIVKYLTIGNNVALMHPLYSIMEMDIIDMFLFFGLFNGLLYLFLFKKVVVGTIKTRYYLFVIFLFFMISFFSGHFFTSIVNAFYILIVFNYLRDYRYDKQ